jgi:hypothetical protein
VNAAYLPWKKATSTSHKIAIAIAMDMMNFMARKVREIAVVHKQNRGHPGQNESACESTRITSSRL